MAHATRKTEVVLATARKELQAQLAVVRDEIARLTAEEQALTQTLSTLNGGNSSPRAGTASARPGRTENGRGSTRKPTAGRRRRRRASKPTADRVEELRGLLAEGPKSRTDLAAALKVSPARVQQLLAKLGGSVSSQAHPERPRAKVWTLKGDANGASASTAPRRRAAGKGKGASTRGQARRKGAAK